LIALIARTTLVTADTRQSVKKIIPVVEDLKRQLGLTSSIEIKLVKNNSLGLSVQPVASRRSDFLLLIDSHFLSRLDSEELRAALAHELGHVWIYTHHPYLQTEELANYIAMRVVPRNSLKRLYVALWAYEGSAGNLDQLLGTERTDSVKAAATDKQ
jgi:hypothetical protein